MDRYPRGGGIDVYVCVCGCLGDEGGDCPEAVGEDDGAEDGDGDDEEALNLPVVCVCVSVCTCACVRACE